MRLIPPNESDEQGVRQLVTAVLALTQSPSRADARTWEQTYRLVLDDVETGKVQPMAMLDVTIGLLVGSVIELAEFRGVSAQDMWADIASDMARHAE